MSSFYGGGGGAVTKAAIDKALGFTPTQYILSYDEPTQTLKLKAVNNAQAVAAAGLYISMENNILYVTYNGKRYKFIGQQV